MLDAYHGRTVECKILLLLVLLVVVAVAIASEKKNDILYVADTRVLRSDWAR